MGICCADGIDVLGLLRLTDQPSGQLVDCPGAHQQDQVVAAPLSCAGAPGAPGVRLGLSASEVAVVREGG